MKIAMLLAATLTATAQAQTTPPAAAPSILDRAVNQPGIGWSVYGANQKAKQVPAEGVPGGAAVRVAVSRKGANPWDVGAGYPTSKPIAEGDTILVAVYLRAPDAKPGTPVTIPIGATETDAPYAQIAATTVEPTAQWKLYYASGTAPKAFAIGKARAALQLSSAKQVVELGPVFLLDFGKGYDPAKLPKN